MRYHENWLNLLLLSFYSRLRIFIICNFTKMDIMLLRSGADLHPSSLNFNSASLNTKRIVPICTFYIIILCKIWIILSCHTLLDQVKKHFLLEIHSIFLKSVKCAWRYKITKDLPILPPSVSHVRSGDFILDALNITRNFWETQVS